MDFKGKIKLFFQALRMMPYKWYWITLMILSATVFSWWDETLVWGASIGLSNYWIVVVYYIIEYAIMMPLVILLGIKTFKKLGVQYKVKELLKQSVKNSLPAVIYRKLKRKRLE
jgi:hypothetical protein